MRKRASVCHSSDTQPRRKLPRGTPSLVGVDLFDALPDDLLVSILAEVSSRAASPADLANASLACRRFRQLVSHRFVLRRASASAIAVREDQWCDEAHRFLKRCTVAGNIEAAYFLGMIRFYCMSAPASGVALMARAAMVGNAAALYSLAVIQFNGSGGGKDQRDLRAGVALCVRAAMLGDVGALRELGHCLQDGYGVRRSLAVGRRLLVHANALEYIATAEASYGRRRRHAAPDPGHAANRFLVKWFASRPPGGELRLCSHARCGRPETRRHEFRRCSVCGKVNYCSRACQQLHWKEAHKAECAPPPPVEPRLLAGGEAAAAAVPAL